MQRARQVFLMGVVLTATVGGALSAEPAKEFTNSIGMKFVLIPAGEFLMGNSELDSDLEQRFAKWEDNPRSYFGDEGPQHKVLITQAFYLGMHEVTVGQFRQFVAAAEYRTDAEKDARGGHGYSVDKRGLERSTRYSWRNPGFAQTEDHPVVNVSWFDATAFCTWLSQRERYQYKLPSEAQWEYACRAGTTTYFGYGDDVEQLTKVGNVWDQTAKARFSGLEYRALSSSDGYCFTAPVGKFQANAWGLYDMHGNVFEWTDDAISTYPRHDVSDPDVQRGLEYARVFRGGCWLFPVAFCRSAARLWGAETDGRRFLGSAFLGFRIIMLPPGDRTNPTSRQRATATMIGSPTKN
jgi:formylglycine-generating enzyme